MKKTKKRIISLCLSLCIISSVIGINASAAAEMTDDMEFRSQLAAIDTATELTNASEDTIDIALAGMQFPEETLRKMSYAQKEKIYRSMLAIDGFNEYVYGGYVEEIVRTEDFDMPLTKSDTFTDNEIRFSAPYIYNGNNLTRYILYPTFEFLMPTYINFDSFAFAVNSSYWNTLYDGGLEITVYGSPGQVIDTFTIDDATVADFAGRQYRIQYYPGDILTRYVYTGVGCMALRPRSSILDFKLTVNYSRDFSDWGIITINPLGSILSTFFDKSIGKELTWGA